MPQSASDSTGFPVSSLKTHHFISWFQDRKLKKKFETLVIFIQFSGEFVTISGGFNARFCPRACLFSHLWERAEMVIAHFIVIGQHRALQALDFFKWRAGKSGH